MSRPGAAVPILPPYGPGQRIGLFGGSFNPPHDGHRHVSLLAMRRLKLDAVWWLVTPGNPLKAGRPLPSLRERLARARIVARHPRIRVTGVEAALGTRFTADTIAGIRRRAPDACFVWIMGADNLGQFHLWRNWRQIAAMVPIAVVDRPGASHRPLRGAAATALAPWRLPESDAPHLPACRPPAWVFLHGPRSALSSTALRGGVTAGSPAGG